MDKSALTVNGEFNYYRYSMKVKQGSNNSWTKIGQIDSFTPRPIPVLRQFLNSSGPKVSGSTAK